MQVLKSFRRDGILYTPGDDLPPGLDTVTLNHYRHHGMIGEAAEAKPAAPRRRASLKPAETKPAAPAETQQPLKEDDAAVHTSAQDAGEFAVADSLAEAASVQPEA